MGIWLVLRLAPTLVGFAETSAATPIKITRCRMNQRLIQVASLAVIGAAALWSPPKVEAGRRHAQDKASVCLVALGTSPCFA